MDLKDKREVVQALLEHIDKEELHTREAARYLNLNPIYVSLAKNEKTWDSMSTAAWNRLEEWFVTRENIKDFSIPAGEEIWKPKEKQPAELKEKEPVNQFDEHNPETLIEEKPVKVAKRADPVVKLAFAKAEIEELNKKIEYLDKKYKELFEAIARQNNKISDIDAKLKLTKLENPVHRPEHGFVIFQRNINNYHK